MHMHFRFVRNRDKSSRALISPKISNSYLTWLEQERNVEDRRLQSRAHAKLHFPCIFSPPRSFPKRFSLLPAFHFAAKTCNSDSRLTDERGKREPARTRPNVISISCLRTHASDHIFPTRSVDQQRPVHRRICTRSAMHFSWQRRGRGIAPETMEACGLWIIHRWRMDAGVQLAWLVSVVSARRDSTDEQIFYKRAGNWHSLDCYFRGPAGISASAYRRGSRRAVNFSFPFRVSNLKRILLLMYIVMYWKSQFCAYICRLHFCFWWCVKKKFLSLFLPLCFLLFF